MSALALTADVEAEFVDFRVVPNADMACQLAASVQWFIALAKLGAAGAFSAEKHQANRGSGRARADDLKGKEARREVGA
jgi:hypothetical protein